MSSLHNLGGMRGFGPVWTVPEGTAFYTDAERRVFRLMMGLMAGGWCDTDGFRAEVEGLPARTYARECFPMNYFLGMEKQLAERGLLQPGDLEAWMQGVRFNIMTPGCPGGRCPSLELLFGFPCHGKFAVSQLNEWNGKIRWCRAYYDSANDPWLTMDIPLWPGGTFEALNGQFAVWSDRLGRFIAAYNLR